MVLLSRTPHEGVIRHLLGENMLKGVYRGGEGVGLVEKLRVMQAPEITVYGLVRHCGHRLQQGQGDIFAFAPRLVVHAKTS